MIIQYGDCMPCNVSFDGWEDALSNIPSGIKPLPKNNHIFNAQSWHHQLVVEYYKAIIGIGFFINFELEGLAK